VRLTGHEVEIAPVKGTRPRGETPEEDAALLADLLGSAKERAEHVMVVDLERNDIGRVCVPGSVRVEPLYEIETTSYCHQAVSSVRGLMRDDASLGDLLEATFPCGSITGAPKIAAMRIAESLECGERGAYTGSLVVAMPGELDSSVLIRTVELQPANVQGGVGEDGAPNAGRILRYGTGCGITVESDPQEEWAESVLKTQPLLGLSGLAASAHGAAGAGNPRIRLLSSAPALTVALKETCRVAGGIVPLWPYHRARLAGGGVPESLLAAIDARVAEAAAEWDGTATKRARLTVVVQPDGSFEVDVAQRLSSLDIVGGVRIARVDVTTPPPLPAPPAKPDDRRYWDAAHHDAELTKAHQAVLVDSAGMVVDGSTSCVWIVESGVLITPPAPPAIPSVSRAFVLAQAERDGLDIRIERISWQRFESADEAFFTNAFGGAAPVRGREGAVFLAVKGLFDEVWGRSEAPETL
jgi:branched-subunit amino acid aminotransferase/4-amino-4-deoxychorismate lyase